MGNKRNITIIKELAETFKPKHRGIIDAGEVSYVRNVIKFENFKTELDLRNLRDMVVMYFSLKEEREELKAHQIFDLMDTMSAIVGVIDGELYNRGYEV